MPIGSVNTVKIYQPQQTSEQFLCRSVECSSQQLRAPPIEASGADCTGRASISFQSRANRRTHKRAFCALGTAHLRCHFIKSTFVRRIAQRLLAFHVTQGANARRKQLDFKWFAPAGRRQEHHFISNVDLQSSESAAPESDCNGDWRASRRERQSSDWNPS